ncbi:aldolase/citrate lyase family protein [Nitratireductor sp. GISD-1A_MAKvit]|uniref:HpcH/HpaI aldolase family protein n=1 Tax=Nitratireductor sp. GISD-1A_MAKvit TaxID=3234198 RepID=UPI003467C38F
MPFSSLATRLEAGEAVFSAWSLIPDSQTVETIAGLDFGAVTLDMQHGGHHEDSVLRGVAGIRFHRKHAVVRIPVGRFDMASRALDMGAEAVIAPMVNTVEDAKAFAEAMKYPPVGLRSWGPGFAMSRTGASDGQNWLGTANAATLAFAMVETRQAFSLLDDILGVEGIDGVLVGPSDFSIAWSNGDTVDPALEEMMPAITSIAAKARTAGKHAAIYVVDPTLVGRFYAMGFRFFAMGAEADYMTQGAASMLSAARDSIGS